MKAYFHSQFFSHTVCTAIKVFLFTSFFKKKSDPGFHPLHLAGHTVSVLHTIHCQTFPLLIGFLHLYFSSLFQITTFVAAQEPQLSQQILDFFSLYYGGLAHVNLSFPIHLFSSLQFIIHLWHYIPRHRAQPISCTLWSQLFPMMPFPSFLLLSAACSCSAFFILLIQGCTHKDPTLPYTHMLQLSLLSSFTAIPNYYSIYVSFLFDTNDTPVAPILCSLLIFPFVPFLLLSLNFQTLIK